MNSNITISGRIAGIEAQLNALGVDLAALPEKQVREALLVVSNMKVECRSLLKASAEWASPTHEEGRGDLDAASDVTHKVERLEAFEERFGVSIEMLFACVLNDDEVKITGRIHARNGKTIQEPLTLEFEVLDGDRLMSAYNDYFFFPEEFFVFQNFSFSHPLGGKPVPKMRVYPRAM